MMRLSDEFKTLTEQLSELYEYRSFLDERIANLEYKLGNFGEMLDFMDSLEETILDSDEEK